MSNPCNFTQAPASQFANQLNSYTVTVLRPGRGDAVRARANVAQRQLATPPSENPETRLRAEPRRQCRRAPGL